MKINRYNSSSVGNPAIDDRLFFAKKLKINIPPIPNKKFINGPAKAT